MKKASKFLSIEYLFYDVIKLICGFLGVLWLRPKLKYVSDESKKKFLTGALVIANHESFIDPAYIQFSFWHRRFHIVCLESFFKSKVAWLFRLFLCIPIDKEDAGVGAFNNIINHLNNDEVVGLFPEGRINRDGNIRFDFKQGVALISLLSQKPVIPVYIKKRKHFYDRLVIVIGERFNITNMYVDKSVNDRINLFTKFLENYEQELSKKV